MNTDVESDLEFLEDEVRCLEADKEELEIENHELLEANSQARERALNVEREMSSLKSTFDDKLFETNNELTMKCLVYTDIIEEYHRLLQQYAGYCRVRLTTNKLNDLRKKGGYTTYDY